MWLKLQRLISYMPFRLLVFVFILWGNSSYAPVLKNGGFYCDDESIKQPYHGDSVHFVLLLTVLLGFFPYLIYITHVLSRKLRGENELSKFHFRLLLRNYYSGFLFILGFTELLKLSFCELRPHFFTTCLPDMKNIQCSNGLITSFNCTGKGPSWLLGRDIYKSFPSGHASLSIYSFVFLNLYLCSRMKQAPITLSSRWWSRSIPVITFIWTVICCVSRILDNRHFWWDVLVGAVIGLYGGFLSFRISMKAASQKKHISNGT